MNPPPPASAPRLISSNSYGRVIGYGTSPPADQERPARPAVGLAGRGGWGTLSAPASRPHAPALGTPIKGIVGAAAPVHPAPRAADDRQRRLDRGRRPGRRRGQAERPADPR